MASSSADTSTPVSSVERLTQSSQNSRRASSPLISRIRHSWLPGRKNLVPVDAAVVYQIDLRVPIVRVTVAAQGSEHGPVAHIAAADDGIYVNMGACNTACNAEKAAC